MQVLSELQLNLRLGASERAAVVAQEFEGCTFLFAKLVGLRHLVESADPRWLLELLDQKRALYALQPPLRHGACGAARRRLAQAGGILCADASGPGVKDSWTRYPEPEAPGMWELIET